MNFTCDNCQKRYSIADEKVRGKTVKVRCKNCQNVITVEGPAEEENTRVVSLADVERIRAQERSLVESAASAPAASAPAAAAPVAASPVSGADALQTPWDDEPTRAVPMRPASSPWFVMVRNKQEGPLDEGVLREWMATGAISGRSFFWQQGMADWKRGADIPELAGLFAPPEPPPPPPPPPPVAEPPPPTPVRSARAAPAWREPEPQPFQPEPEPEQPYAPESQQHAWEPEQDEPGRTFFEEPDPRQQPSQGRRGHGAAPAASAQLNNDELFSDLDLPGNRSAGDEDDGQGPQEDPLAALGGGDENERQPVEDTRHFAAKSGVTRRNPAWKYAVAVLLLLVVPLGGAYVLSETLGVVPLRVKTVDAEGNPVEQTVFSTKGVGALRDKLMGRQPPAPSPVVPPAEKRPASPSESVPAPAKRAPAGAGAPAGIVPPPSAEQLQAVYADAEKKDVGPEVRKDAEVAATDSDEVGGPSDEEVERVVAKAQDAFRSCVENELRKNPSFRVGKVTLTATVSTSGKVKAASLDKKDLNRSGVGTCIRERAKSMVFSAFSGDDVDLEIPLVLSGTM